MSESEGYRDIKVTAQASSIEKWRKQVIAGQPENRRAVRLHQR